MRNLPKIRSHRFAISSSVSLFEQLPLRSTILVGRGITSSGKPVATLSLSFGGKSPGNNSRLGFSSGLFKGSSEYNTKNTDLEQELPPDFLLEYQNCHRFLTKNCLGKGDHNWKISSGDHNKDPLNLESAVYQKEIAGSNVYCVRGRLRFPGVRPNEVRQLILKLHERPRWDTQMSKGKVHVKYHFNHPNIQCDLAHLCYHGQWSIVEARDLCLLRFWGKYFPFEEGAGTTEGPDGIISNSIVAKSSAAKTRDTSDDVQDSETETDDHNTLMLLAKSVVDDAIPETEDHVRATLHECGYCMQPGTVDAGTAGYPKGKNYYSDVTYISSLDFNGSFPPTFTNIILQQQPATLLKMREILLEEESKDCSVM